MSKAFLPLLGFLLLAGLFYIVLLQMDSGAYDPREVPTEFIGREAPSFTLPNLYDLSTTVSTESMRGRVWLLNVWGTWCPECWREHAFLVHLAGQGVPIVGLNWRDTVDEAIAMLTDKGDPFEFIGYDPRSDAVIEWGVYGAPETFLIDADGIVRVLHKGMLTAADWERKFAPFFAADEDAS
jgi:cytochrome c biogenesis protein CcmG/thiol:disulfide interchange protein DsbE